MLKILPVTLKIVPVTYIICIFLIYRVAVLANTYQDMTVSLPPLTPALEGRRELAASQLQSLGYHVITVSPQL